MYALKTREGEIVKSRDDLIVNEIMGSQKSTVI
jgi:hypothetical protein